VEVGGVDPDTRDENGWTLLRTAAWSGQAHCVQVRLPETRIRNLNDYCSQIGISNVAEVSI
jgi:ankyrin repeat protein